MFVQKGVRFLLRDKKVGGIEESGGLEGGLVEV